MYDVTIKVALNGYIARVGCQRLVFTDRVQMLKALDEYLENPFKVEQMYRDKSLNSRQLGFTGDSAGSECARPEDPRNYIPSDED